MRACFFILFLLFTQTVYGQTSGSIKYDRPEQTKSDAIPPPSFEMNLAPPIAVTLPALSAEQLEILRGSKNNKTGALRRSKGHPITRALAGFHRTLLVKGIEHLSGGWQNTIYGPVWRLKLTSPEASSVRLQFKKVNIKSGQMWVYNDNGAFDGPYSGRGTYNNGNLWTLDMAGSSITIEYWPASEVQKTIPFRIAGLSHIVHPEY